MKILIHENIVDFEAPIYMSENQRKEFAKGMRTIFGASNIEEREIIEKKKMMGDIERHPKRFSKDDLAQMIASYELDNEEIGGKFKKTEFAILMKRGPLLTSFREWAKKNKKNKITKSEIEEFVNENFR